MAYNIPDEWNVNNNLSTPLSKQLADNIRWSISTGNLLHGDKLPPLRKLANKLNLSVNTVRAAYKMLEKQQLVITRPHYGTEVVDFSSEMIKQSNKVSNNAKDLLLQAVIKAINSGLSFSEIRILFEAVLEQVSKVNKTTHILLIECSEYESKNLSEQLSQNLGVSVDYVVLDDLDDFLKQGNITQKNYQVIVTSYFHYAKVIQSVQKYDIPVLGMVVEMSPESLNYITSMPPGSKVGIICHPNHSLQYLINLIQTQSKNIEIMSAFPTESQKYNNLIKNADAIFVAPTFKKQVQEQGPSKPVFSVLDRINDQSIGMLYEYLQRMQAE